jgi:hypothetical protein
MVTILIVLGDSAARRYSRMASQPWLGMRSQWIGLVLLMTVASIRCICRHAS